MAYYNNIIGPGIQGNQNVYSGAVGAPLYHIGSLPQQPVNMVPTRVLPPASGIANHYPHGTVEHSIVSALAYQQGDCQAIQMKPGGFLHTAGPTAQSPNLPQGHLHSKTGPLTPQTEVNPSYATEAVHAVRSRAIPIISPDTGKVNSDKSVSDEATPVSATSRVFTKAVPITPDPASSRKSKAIPIVSPVRVSGGKSKAIPVVSPDSGSNARSNAVPILPPGTFSGGKSKAVPVSPPDVVSSERSNAVPIVSPGTIYSWKSKAAHTPSLDTTSSTSSEIREDAVKICEVEQTEIEEEWGEAVVRERSAVDIIYDQFIAVLEEHGPQKPSSDLILGQFIALKSVARKIVMTKGSVRNFLLDSDRVELRGELLHLTETKKKSYNEKNEDILNRKSSGVEKQDTHFTLTHSEPCASAHKVKTSNLSSVDLFEEKMQQYGIEVNQPYAESEGSAEYGTPEVSPERPDLTLGKAECTDNTTQPCKQKTTSKVTVPDGYPTVSCASSSSSVTPDEEEQDCGAEIFSDADMTAFQAQLDSLTTRVVNCIVSHRPRPSVGGIELICGLCTGVEYPTILSLLGGSSTEKQPKRKKSPTQQHTQCVADEVQMEEVEDTSSEDVSDSFSYTSSNCSSDWSTSITTDLNTVWLNNRSSAEETKSNDTHPGSNNNVKQSAKNFKLDDLTTYPGNYNSSSSVKDTKSNEQSTDNQMQCAKHSNSEDLERGTADKDILQLFSKHVAQKRSAASLENLTFKGKAPTVWSTADTEDTSPSVILTETLSNNHTTSSGSHQQSTLANKLLPAHVLAYGSSKTDARAISNTGAFNSAHLLVTNSQVVGNQTLFTNPSHDLNAGAHEFVPGKSLVPVPSLPPVQAISAPAVNPMRQNLNIRAHPFLLPSSQSSVNTMLSKPSISAIIPQPNVNVIHPQSSVSAVHPQPNTSAIIPQSRVCVAVPQSRVNPTHYQPSISKVYPQPNVSEVHPQFNIAEVHPQSNTSTVSPQPNIIADLSQSNLRQVHPQSNTRTGLPLPKVNEILHTQFALMKPVSTVGSTLSQTTLSVGSPEFKPRGFVYSVPVTCKCLSAPSALTPPGCDQGTNTPPLATQDRGTTTPKQECRELGVQSMESSLNVAEVCINTTESMCEPNSLYHLPLVDTKDVAVGTTRVGESVDKCTQTGSRGNLFMQDTGCQADLTDSTHKVNSGEDDLYDPALESQYQALLQQMMITLLQTNPTMISDSRLLKRTAYHHLLAMLGKVPQNTAANNAVPTNTTAPMQPDFMGTASSGLFNPFMGMPVMSSCIPMPNMFGMPPMFNTTLSDTQSFMSSAGQSNNSDSQSNTGQCDVENVPAGKKLKNVSTEESEPELPAAKEPTPQKTSKNKKARAKKKSGNVAKEPIKSSPTENFEPVMDTDKGFRFTEKESVTFQGNCPTDKEQKVLDDVRAPISVPNTAPPSGSKSKAVKKKNKKALTSVSSSLTSLSTSEMESAESRPDTPLQQHTSLLNCNNSNAASIQPVAQQADSVPESWEDEADLFAPVFKITQSTTSEIKLPDPNSAQVSSVLTTYSQSSCSESLPVSSSNTVLPSQPSNAIDEVKSTQDFTAHKMDSLDDIVDLPQSRRKVRLFRSASTSPEVPDFVPAYLKKPGSLPQNAQKKNSVHRPPGLSVQKPSNLSWPKPTQQTAGSNMWCSKGTWGKPEKPVNDDRSQVRAKTPEKSAFRAPPPVPALMSLNPIHRDTRKMNSLKKSTKTQEGFPSISKDSMKVSELCNIEVEKGDSREMWQQVGNKKKRGRETANPVSTVPANLIGRKMVSLVGQVEEKKNTNFEKLVVKLQDKFPGLDRSEVLGLMNEVRAKRGTLKGIAMSVLVADAEAVMASRKARSASGTSPQNCNDNTVSPTKITLCSALRKGKQCHKKGKCDFAHSAAEVEQNKALMYKASVNANKTLAADDGLASIALVGETDFDFVPSEEEPDSTECLICKNHIRMSYGTKLDCGHEFHDKCIKSWIIGQERTCPLCRKLTLLKDEFPSLGS